MKTKNNSLPTRETLTIAAAATQRKNPADAVQHALALWREAGATLEAQAFAGIPLPGKFPATLADFLRVVVRAKTQGEGTGLLRRFYHEQYFKWCKDEAEAAERAAGEIAGWKVKDWKGEDGFKTAAQWAQLATRFQDWRQRDKSTKASESALKRTKKPKSAAVVKRKP